MGYVKSIGAVALAAGIATGSAQAFDDAKYPDWSGQWLRARGVTNQATWDPDKAWGAKQEPPLTPKYQAIFEANLDDQKAGGQGTDPSWRCIPSAMPRIMLAVQPFEIVVMPETTYMAFEIFSTLRRIYTDGRPFPDQITHSYSGYSVGHWEDTDGDGRYDTLVVETRGIKGPHSYDNSGIPFHEDEQAVVKERIYSDKTNPNLLWDEITTIDNALTRPWTVKRSFRRSRAKQPPWSEYICTEDNRHVEIGNQNYVIGADDRLMPTRKNQSPPDLRHFNEAER
jgi:hypothetical protein